jgi:very-short-patch-repair endonuclease
MCPSCRANDKEMRTLIEEMQPKKGIAWQATHEQQMLYLALKALNWDLKLEYKCKRKTVDIAIPSIYLFIEVNGLKHAEDPDQIRSDLWRIHSSLKEGFLTLPVFNSALSNAELQKTVSIIDGIAKERKQAINNERQDETKQ